MPLTPHVAPDAAQYSFSVFPSLKYAVTAIPTIEAPLGLKSVIAATGTNVPGSYVKVTESATAVPTTPKLPKIASPATSSFFIVPPSLLSVLPVAPVPNRCWRVVPDIGPSPPDGPATKPFDASVRKKLVLLSLYAYPGTGQVKARHFVAGREKRGGRRKRKPGKPEKAAGGTVTVPAGHGMAAISSRRRRSVPRPGRRRCRGWSHPCGAVPPGPSRPRSSP